MWLYVWLLVVVIPVLTHLRNSPSSSEFPITETSIDMEESETSYILHPPCTFPLRLPSPFSSHDPLNFYLERSHSTLPEDTYGDVARAGSSVRTVLDESFSSASHKAKLWTVRLDTESERMCMKQNFR